MYSFLVVNPLELLIIIQPGRYFLNLKNERRHFVTLWGTKTILNKNIGHFGRIYRKEKCAHTKNDTTVLKLWSLSVWETLACLGGGRSAQKIHCVMWSYVGSSFYPQQKTRNSFHFPFYFSWDAFWFWTVRSRPTEGDGVLTKVLWADNKSDVITSREVASNFYPGSGDLEKTGMFCNAFFARDFFYSRRPC